MTRDSHTKRTDLTHILRGGLVAVLVPIITHCRRRRLSVPLELWSAGFAVSTLPDKQRHKHRGLNYVVCCPEEADPLSPDWPFHQCAIYITMTWVPILLRINQKTDECFMGEVLAQGVVLCTLSAAQKRARIIFLSL